MRYDFVTKGNKIRGTGTHSQFGKFKVFGVFLPNAELLWGEDYEKPRRIATQHWVKDFGTKYKVLVNN